MFANCYFDWTKTIIDCGTDNKWNHYFVGCHWILGTADRGLELRTETDATTGAGLILSGCRFKGDSGDIDIECTQPVDGYWVGVLDREYQLVGCQFGTWSTPEAFFKAGKNFTIDATNGHSYFRRNDDGYGRTEISGSNLTLGLDRYTSGSAGVYMQWESGVGNDDDISAMYAGATGNLIFSNLYSSGDIIFSPAGLWAALKIQETGRTEIYGTAGVSSSTTALKVGSASGRSISAAGTINASGADYAEYHEVIEPLWGEVSKGDILGFDADGLLTDRFADVRSRFVIKSTEPNLVGGDIWGSEEALCERYDLEPVGHKPENPEEMDAWKARRDAMEKAYEQERIKYDRIAKAGYVPVNIQATADDIGKYLVPVQGEEGAITAQLIDPNKINMRQYVAAIGVVIGIYSDGRPKVEVKPI